MNKCITCIFTVIALLSLCASEMYAKEAIESASINIEYKKTDIFDYRVENLRKFLLTYNSPLTEHADAIVQHADIYGIDYRMVPAITGVESTFGKHIPKESYNAYGWANGKYKFSSWEDSIEIVAYALKNNYIDKGAQTISQIAKRYAPPSKTWENKVRYFIAKIDILPLDFDII